MSSCSQRAWDISHLTACRGFLPWVLRWAEDFWEDIPKLGKWCCLVICIRGGRTDVVFISLFGFLDPLQSVSGRHIFHQLIKNRSAIKSTEFKLKTHTSLNILSMHRSCFFNFLPWYCAPGFQRSCLWKRFKVS